MKSIFKKALIIFFIVSLFAGKSVYADTNTNNEIIKNQNNMMEKYLELENKYSELKEKWADEKIELEDEKRNVDLKLIRILTIASGLIVVGGIFENIAIKKYIKDKVAEIADKNIKSEVKKVVENYEKEIKIKKNKSICVIYNDDDNSIIKETLNKFDNISYLSANNISMTSIKFKKIDAIIFNDINDKLDIISIENIIKSNNNDKLVYLGFKKGYFHFQEEFKNKVKKMNYANSEITLYTNLMNALKYQDEVLLNK